MKKLKDKENNKKKIIIISIIVLIILTCLIIGLYFLLRHDVKVDLKGDSETIIEIGSDFKDSGIVLTDNNKKIEPNEYEIIKKETLKTDELGEYKIEYTIKYRKKEYKLTRKVKVIDQTEPEITTNITELVRDYCTKQNKEELTYTAIDNYDGDLTEQVTSEEIENNITLTVSDKSGNTKVLNIPITYSEKPSNQIKINGSKSLNITINGTYTEQGATAYDGCGNKIDEEIITEGSVDTTKNGTYNIKYYLKNDSNISVTRKVVVYTPAPVTTNTSNGGGKTLYLTFDDGPCTYTRKVLDTLAKYNVKATFFVTNQFSGYVNLIADEYNAGHAVGVHSYTHAWNIYDSVDNYLNDFNKMNDVVERYTGQRAKIFRFPGGSSNTVSKKHSTGVVTAIANRMTQDGYVYFDWDVSSGDASNATQSQIYNNVVNGAARCKDCVFLMHDIKKNTVNELDHILQTLTSQGYSFGTLNTSSPTAHQKIAN